MEPIRLFPIIVLLSLVRVEYPLSTTELVNRAEH